MNWRFATGELAIVVWRLGEFADRGTVPALPREMQVADALRQRTFTFATRIVELSRRLPQDSHAREVGRQLLKAGTSVAANYRAACRGRSRREFIAKLGVAVEEADETMFWLELIEATGLYRDRQLGAVRQEALELVSILARSHRTARDNFHSAE